MAELIRTLADGAVHVIAESAGAAAGCCLAVLELRLFGPNPGRSAPARGGVAILSN
jgi:hypothetical protein